VSLADIYRNSIYSSSIGSAKQQLLVESILASAIRSTQFSRLVCSTIELEPAKLLDIAMKYARNLIRFKTADLNLHLDLDHHLALARPRVVNRDGFRNRALTRHPRVITSVDPDLVDALAHTQAVNPLQRPEIQGDKAGRIKTFAEAEWIFFAPEAYDKEGEELINKLKKLTQAKDDWTQLLALSALLSLGEGSPAMCEERNALLEKGIESSDSFIFPAELHAETESEAFREKLPELLEIIYLHDPKLIWLRPELFDASHPESKYFLSKPREFFMLAAETLDPKHETDLWKWHEQQENKKS
jgi:hypothetical protein